MSEMGEAINIWGTRAQTISMARVSLVSQGSLQIRIQFVRQRFDPTLEINKQTKGKSNREFKKLK